MSGNYLDLAVHYCLLMLDVKWRGSEFRFTIKGDAEMR